MGCLLTKGLFGKRKGKDSCCQKGSWVKGTMSFPSCSAPAQASFTPSNKCAFSEHEKFGIITVEGVAQLFGTGKPASAPHEETQAEADDCVEPDLNDHDEEAGEPSAKRYKSVLGGSAEDQRDRLVCTFVSRNVKSQCVVRLEQGRRAWRWFNNGRLLGWTLPFIACFMSPLR